MSGLTVYQTGPTTYRVEGGSNPHHLDTESGDCDCEWWAWYGRSRKYPNKRCKHMEAVREFIKQRKDAA